MQTQSGAANLSPQHECHFADDDFRRHFGRRSRDVGVGWSHSRAVCNGPEGGARAAGAFQPRASCRRLGHRLPLLSHHRGAAARLPEFPPTEVCMNCHKQVWTNSPMLEPVRASLRENKPIAWNRVNNVPDFVYFDHSIHIHKGVGCETCHGRVDQMPLTWKVASLQMEWCLNCHRAPEKYLRPREEVFTMGWQPPIPQRGTRAAAVEANTTSIRPGS